MSGESCNIKWNTYTHHLADMLGDILTSELYSDVSLECEGGRLQAHRAVLSACSPFFKHIFEEDDQEHPVIWMPGIQIEEMEAILQFMYCGQTTFEQKKTYQFLRVGKHLGIKELDKDIGPVEEESGDAEDSKMSDVSDILHEANGIMHGTFAPNGEEAPDLLNLDQVKEEPKSDSLDQSETAMAMYGHNMDVKPEISMSGAPPGKIAIQPEKKRVRKKSEQPRKKKGPQESKYSHISADPNSSECPTCHKMFAHRKNMIAHYKSQHEGTRVTCPYCSKDFSKQGNLTMHIQSVHEGAKYTCNICDQQFSYANNLKTHIQSVHEGVKYPCTYCEKIYTDKSTLFRHIASKHKQNN